MMIEVKVCENCNHRNPVNAVECEKCGYDLTFAFPQMVEETPEPVEKQNQGASRETTVMVQPVKPGDWELVSLANESDRFVLGAEVALGRDCDVFNEQFNSSNYTSRTHAKLRVVGDEVQVMDASTNGTFVNEKRIPKLEWITIQDGSSIRFADVSFKVRRNQGAD